MLKKTITYTDYNNQERTEDFYFNLNKTEVVELHISEVGGLDKTMEKLIKETDQKRIAEIFKELILKAYGEKSLDGKRFIKAKELSEAFSQTEAYVELWMELASNAETAVAFFNAVMPQQTQDHKKAGE